MESEGRFVIVRNFAFEKKKNSRSHIWKKTLCAKNLKLSKNSDTKPKASSTLGDLTFRVRKSAASHD